jgi:flagellar basal-body rod protein FlgC
MPSIPPRLGLLPTLAPQTTVRPMFRPLAIAASGLSAQRQRLETVASNLANAETTRTEGGGPYRRRVAVLQAATGETQLFGATTPPGQSGTVANPIPPFGTAAFQVPALAGSAGDTARGIQVPFLPPLQGDGQHGVRVAEVVEDQSEGPLVYDPGHPDADPNGYVRYPNVRVTDEMIDLLDAKRVYEANATVFQSAKAMLKKALEI